MFLKRPESMPKIKNVEWLTENSVRLTVHCGYENRKQRKFRTTLKIPEGKTLLAKVRFIETEYAKFRAEVERGEVAEKQITVEKFAALWMQDDVKARGLSPVTVSGYENFLQAHILPALGKTRLDRLTPHTITRFYNELAKKPGRNGKPISSRYVCNVHGVLRTMLNVAVRWGYLTRNPVDAATPPRSDTQRPDIYDLPKCRALLDALAEEPVTYRAAILLTLFTGMRKGEVAGLDWKNVDLEEGRVRIVQEAVYLGKQGVALKAPKTTAGQRTVTIPAIVITELKALKRWQAEKRLLAGNAWQNSGAVFIGELGARLHPDTIPGWFAKFLARKGLPHIRFHALRHTIASIMIDLGESDVAVALRLGHTNANTTRAIYAQAFKAREASTAERAADAILNAK